MMDKDKAVQGVSLYAEFSKEGATTQVIVSPDGFNNEGDETGYVIVRRVITKDSPKKPWRFFSAAKITPVPIQDIEADEYAAARLAAGPRVLFDQILAGGWTLVNRPILVETSKKDFDDLIARRTPTKMLYRIGLCRKAYGFPESIIN